MHSGEAAHTTFIVLGFHPSINHTRDEQPILHLLSLVWPDWDSNHRATTLETSSQYYIYSLWFDPTGIPTIDQPHSRRAANTTSIVFGLTRLGFQPSSNHTWDEHINHYITNSNKIILWGFYAISAIFQFSF